MNIPDILRTCHTLAVVGLSNDRSRPAYDVSSDMQNIPPVVDDAIAAGAKVIWMQQGIWHDEAATKARAAGIEVVMDRCIRTELRRMLMGM